MAFDVEPYFGGWTFRIRKVTLEGVKSLQAGRIVPACGKYVGNLANMVSDDDSGVCLRAFSTTALYQCASFWLAVALPAEGGLEGQAFGLAAGPRAELQAMLRGMTLEAGVPRSDCGGAWSLGAEANRCSYLISDAVRADNVDEWLAFLRRTGVKDIAAMKINAITNRGTRKDFVDMARLLDDYSIEDMFAWYCGKYPAANPALAMRSMSYFVDAETMPMPRMLISFDWEDAKDRIRAAVRKLAM